MQTFSTLPTPMQPTLGYNASSASMMPAAATAANNIRSYSNMHGYTFASSADLPYMTNNLVYTPSTMVQSNDKGVESTTPLALSAHTSSVNIPANVSAFPPMFSLNPYQMAFYMHGMQNPFGFPSTISPMNPNGSFQSHPATAAATIGLTGTSSTTPNANVPRVAWISTASGPAVLATTVPAISTEPLKALPLTHATATNCITVPLSSQPTMAEIKTPIATFKPSPSAPVSVSVTNQEAGKQSVATAGKRRAAAMLSGVSNSDMEAASALSIVKQARLRRQSVSPVPTESSSRTTSPHPKPPQRGRGNSNAAAWNYSRKSRKNTRERARRRELNEYHDDVSATLYRLREERVELKIRIRDFCQKLKSILVREGEVPTVDQDSATSICEKLRQQVLGKLPISTASADGNAENPSKTQSHDAHKPQNESNTAMIANRTAVLLGAVEMVEWQKGVVEALEQLHASLTRLDLHSSDKKSAVALEADIERSCADLESAVSQGGNNNNNNNNHSSADSNVADELESAEETVSPVSMGLSPSVQRNPNGRVRSGNRPANRIMRKNAREQQRRREINISFSKLGSALGMRADSKKLYILLQAIEVMSKRANTIKTYVEGLHHALCGEQSEPRLLLSPRRSPSSSLKRKEPTPIDDLPVAQQSVEVTETDPSMVEAALVLLNRSGMLETTTKPSMSVSSPSSIQPAKRMAFKKEADEAF